MLDKDLLNEEILAPISAVSYIDRGILKKLPPGTIVRGISPSGASYWARTAKIEATNTHGDTREYFLKVLRGDKGKYGVASEFHSMQELYRVMPEIVIKPVAWGSYEEIPDTHFFLCDFREMNGDIPDLACFPALLAQMHKRGISPDGNFGYPVATFGGNRALIFPIQKTWEKCFSMGLQGVFAAEFEMHGPDEELRILTKTIFEKVIPRLLRPLESEGRSITPCLVHGDLWDGNASVDLATGRPVIFDGTPLYAHNEYDLAPWRCPHHKMTKAYIDEYSAHYESAEPKEELYDRLDLYCLRFTMHGSSMFPGNLKLREYGKKAMRELVAKYREGYEGYAERKGIAFSGS